jgi:Dolichyl-phosphate-mannose-protein mannosyltransferase
MKNFLIIISIFVVSGISISIIPQGIVAIALSAFFSAIIILVINNFAESESKSFLIQTFVGSVIVRLVLAAIIFGLNLEVLFGPDAISYHKDGTLLANSLWNGTSTFTDLLANLDLARGGNWSMPYIVTLIYLIVGTNPLAVQAFSCVLGSATAIVIYFIAKMIYSNERVARFSAILVGFFPAMIIWSSQMLKDGFIIFLISIILLTALRLQKKFTFFDFLILIVSLVSIFTLRFYLFPLLSVAIIGGFVINAQASIRNILSRIFAFVFIGVVLSFFGVLERSQEDLGNMSDLSKLENVRKYGNYAADSGIYDEDTNDISTISGALQALPSGFITLLLAPFPWQMGKIQQQLLSPEMMLWWMMIPFLATGFWYSIKTRFREFIPILLFLITLTVSYSLFQGNLGTLYRQRIQIQIFLLMFISVGFVMFLEKRENARLNRFRLPLSSGKN